VLGIIGAFMFSLIQDMSNLMVLVDLWTITHIIIIVAQIVSISIILKRDKATLESNNRELAAAEAAEAAAY